MEYHPVTVTSSHPMDAAYWVIWGEGIETPYSTGSSWRPTYMHCLLSFFCYLFILWPSSHAASSVSWYRSCHVCSGLDYEIYSGGGPSMYAYCVVCYSVIVAPYIRSVGHVFAYLYTLDDDSECPVYYETSLLPKVFPTEVVFLRMNILLKVCIWGWLSHWRCAFEDD